MKELSLFFSLVILLSALLFLSFSGTLIYKIIKLFILYFLFVSCFDMTPISICFLSSSFSSFFSFRLAPLTFQVAIVIKPGLLIISNFFYDYLRTHSLKTTGEVPSLNNLHERVTKPVAKPLSLIHI